MCTMAVLEHNTLKSKQKFIISSERGNRPTARTQACAMLFPVSSRKTCQHYGLNAIKPQHIGNHPLPPTHTHTNAPWQFNGAYMHVCTFMKCCLHVDQQQDGSTQCREADSHEACWPCNFQNCLWHQLPVGQPITDTRRAQNHTVLSQHCSAIFSSEHTKTQTLPRTDLVATRWPWQVCGGRKW